RLDSVLLFLHRSPARIGVEAINCPRDRQRVRTEVLFINNAVLTDHEGLHPSHSILSRRRKQREAADHHTLHNIIELSQRRRRSLAFEDVKEVSPIRFIATGVTSRNRLCDILSDGTVPGAIAFLPRKAILSTRRADDSLGELTDLTLSAFKHRV